MSWPESLSMGGYAFYVWGAHALLLAAMGGEVLLLWRRAGSMRPRVDVGAAQHGAEGMRS